MEDRINAFIEVAGKIDDIASWGFSRDKFLLFACMMFDEYCRLNPDENPVELAEQVYVTVKAVNEEFGRYD